MNVEGVLESIVQATLNYIVVSSISSSNQKQTVTDLKTDLRTTKEDLMSEMKDTRESILAKMETDTTAMNEITKARFDSQKKEGDKNGGTNQST